MTLKLTSIASFSRQLQGGVLGRASAPRKLRQRTVHFCDWSAGSAENSLRWLQLHLRQAMQRAKVLGVRKTTKPQLQSSTNHWKSGTTPGVEKRLSQSRTGDKKGRFSRQVHHRNDLRTRTFEISGVSSFFNKTIIISVCSRRFSSICMYIV